MIRTQSLRGAAQRPEVQGVLMVLLGAFCFSLGIPLTRWTDGVDSRAIAGFRGLFGFLFLSLMLVRNPELLHFRRYRASLRGLLMVSVCIMLTITLYTFSIDHATAAVSALGVNTAPVYVALLGPMLTGDKRAPQTWTSLALAAAGMILVSDPAKLRSGEAELVGVLAACASGATYGGVMLVGRRLRGKVSGLTQSMWGNGLTALTLMPWVLATPVAVLQDNWLLLVLNGALTVSMGYMLYLMAAQRVSAQVVSITSLFEPMSGIALGMVFFAEYPNALGLLGGLLIVASIYLIVK